MLQELSLLLLFSSLLAFAVDILFSQLRNRRVWFSSMEWIMPGQPIYPPNVPPAEIRILYGLIKGNQRLITP